MNADRLAFHEYAEIFPMMPLEELDTLAADIKVNGLLEPITLYEGKILDGRNRYVACLSVAGDPRFTQYPGVDPLGFVASKNVHRRHLNESQRAVIADNMANLSHGGDHRKNQDARGHLGRVSREEAAMMMQVSPRTVARVRTVKQQAPDLMPKIASGELTARAAIREVKHRVVLGKLQDIGAQEARAIEGVYDVIVIDPPWPMQKIERDVRPNQSAFDYPTMTEDELTALQIPCADDCHVWVWTTHKFLPMALRLLDTWKFKYVCTFVWHKPGGFQPYGLPQYNCEFALYARRGSPIFMDTKALPVCFDAPRGGHSEKPGEFYETVCRVTGGRRLDMFSRRQIDGFDAWGNEASNGI